MRDLPCMLQPFFSLFCPLCYLSHITANLPSPLANVNTGFGWFIDVPTAYYVYAGWRRYLLVNLNTKRLNISWQMFVATLFLIWWFIQDDESCSFSRLVLTLSLPLSKALNSLMVTALP